MKRTYLIGTALLITLLSAHTVNAEQATQKKGYSLAFETRHYTQSSISIDGQTVEYRAFEHIVYVRRPVDTQYQQMNIYIPEAYFHGQSVGSFDAKTAPIFLPNTIGGYMPGEAGKLGMSRDGNGPNAASVALSKGYVVAMPGARGRTLQNKQGLHTGKAPAAIVDLKAAVRYLRFNDRAMPGDAEKIISNGTSAGGAISALLGASGNSPEYASYLKALGAADTRDDIFAVSAYCPILNLEHADAAYEWQFNGINDYKRMNFSGMMQPIVPPKPAAALPNPANVAEMPIKPKEIASTLTADQIQTSNDLKALFPDYLNSLKLKDDLGNTLTLDAQGNGNFKAFIKALVISAAQTAIKQGASMAEYPWVHVEHGQVTDIDYDQYLQAISRMKTPPAFDALDLSSGENDLFGTAHAPAQHFTDYSAAHTAKPATKATSNLVNLMNPMHFIGNTKAKPANFWRIRHGTADRDTSLAISAILATKLQNTGKQVDYALPWARPHSGDYDLNELFAWMASITKPH